MLLAHSPLETIPDPVSPRASSFLATVPVVANPVSSPISEMYASPVKRGRRAGTTNKQRRDIVTGELKSSGVDVTPLLNRRMSIVELRAVLDRRRKAEANERQREVAGKAAQLGQDRRTILGIPYDLPLK